MKETEGQKAWNSYWRQTQPCRHYPKNHNILPVIIVIIIISIIISLVKNGTFHLLSDGTLDIETTRYLDDVKQTEIQMKKVIEEIKSKYQNDLTNIVDIRKDVNDLDSLYGIQIKQRVAKPYKSFKEDNDNESKAIIDTIHTMLDTNNYEAIKEVLEADNKAGINRTDALIKLFDQNKINYTVKTNKDGSTEITFSYKTIGK